MYILKQRSNKIMQNENIKIVDGYQHIDGTDYQLGKLYTSDGKQYDITVIMNWNPTAFDDDTDDDQTVRLIDFYFGDQDDRYTADYVKQYIEKQNKFKKLLSKLYELKAQNPDDTEIDEQIDFIKSQIHKLY
jgi:hypothetical protein